MPITAILAFLLVAAVVEGVALTSMEVAAGVLCVTLESIGFVTVS